MGSASTVTSREVAILRTSFAPSHAYRGAAARVLVRVLSSVSLPLIKDDEPNVEDVSGTTANAECGSHRPRRAESIEFEIRAVTDNASGITPGALCAAVPEGQ